MSYGLQFIDITRFMASSLSNLPEGTHKVKCTSSNKCYHEYTNFHENLKKEFVNTNKLANEQWTSLFCYCENVFIYMNTQMVGRNLMSDH